MLCFCIQCLDPCFFPEYLYWHVVASLLFSVGEGWSAPVHDCTISFSSSVTSLCASLHTVERRGSLAFLEGIGRKRRCISGAWPTASPVGFG